ncbi:MAG: hypothetical protein IPN18_16425 [Ignavibacteriales bacterium]|nr:hypothetical protein [Ignavibacteriales bacterium]
MEDTVRACKTCMNTYFQKEMNVLIVTLLIVSNAMRRLKKNRHLQHDLCDESYDIAKISLKEQDL